MVAQSRAHRRAKTLRLSQRSRVRLNGLRRHSFLVLKQKAELRVSAQSRVVLAHGPRELPPSGTDSDVGEIIRPQHRADDFAARRIHQCDARRAFRVKVDECKSQRIIRDKAQSRVTSVIQRLRCWQHACV